MNDSHQKEFQTSRTAQVACIMKQNQPTKKKHGIPSAYELRGKWKQQIGTAKIFWGELTENELLKIEGHQEKLAGLVQQRYAISRDDAEKQVKEFFSKN